MQWQAIETGRSTLRAIASTGFGALRFGSKGMTSATWLEVVVAEVAVASMAALAVLHPLAAQVMWRVAAAAQLVRAARRHPTPVRERVGARGSCVLLSR